MKSVGVTHRRSENRCSIPVLIVAVYLGAVFGVVFYLCAAIAIDWLVVLPARLHGGPGQSYAQAACLVSAPLAAVLGGAFGLSVTCPLHRASALAASVTIAGGLLVGVVACDLWQSDIERYGRDVSEFVVFVPIVIGSAAVVSTGLTLGAFLIVKKAILVRKKNREVSPQPTVPDRATGSE